MGDYKHKYIVELELVFNNHLLQASYYTQASQGPLRPYKQTWLEERRSFRRGLPTTTSTKTSGDQVAFHCGRSLI